MSEAVLKFADDRTEYPSDRVTRFVALARGIEALVPNGEWDANVWQVGASFMTKGQNRDSRALAFYNCDATLIRGKEVVGGAPLARSIREFAKAYVQYSHSTSSVAFENTAKRLAALRFIEAGFRSLGLEPLIENINVTVLNTAVSIARQGVGAGRHYQFANQIQRVHRFCFDRHFLVAPFQWKHGVRKPKDKNEEIGKDARDRRNKKLPSPEAFYALAEVFRTADSFIDNIYSSVCVLCIAFPIRAHEVLQLRLDCEVYARTTNEETGEEVDAYGIRVWPGKGNPPQVKWVPSVMVTVVQEAVQRLRDMCADARNVAAWYEKHPDRLWLPEGRRGSDLLPFSALTEVIGITSPREQRKWLRAQNVEWTPDYVTISSLAEKLLPLQPKDFPYYNREADQAYSNTLILLLYNQGHVARGVYPALLEKATVQGFENWLSGRDGDKKPSIFKRKGFTERDGSDIRITTHVFRHWLNTVAQLKGMSDLDIAKWSGRDVQQNPAYDHVTPEETLSLIRAALDDGSGIGPMFEAGRMLGINQPVDRSEFADAQIGAALTTELGICVHDYSLLPCQFHGDCLGCSENVFIKGDSKHRENIAKRLDMSIRQLNDALWAMGADYFGADKWVQSHEASIASMKQILATHDDPAILDGTIISLGGGSRDGEIAMALRDRADGCDDADHPTKLADEEDGDMPDEILSGMWED